MHVVAADRDQPRDELRPEHRRHARGPPAPVEARHDRPGKAKPLDQLTQIARERGLLPGAHDRRIPIPAGTVAAKIRHDHLGAVARDQIGDPVETARVIRKTVQKYDRPPRRIAPLLVADLHPAADDRSMFRRHASHRTDNPCPLKLAWDAARAVTSRRNVRWAIPGTSLERWVISFEDL